MSSKTCKNDAHGRFSFRKKLNDLIIRGDLEYNGSGNCRKSKTDSHDGTYSAMESRREVNCTCK